MATPVTMRRRAASSRRRGAWGVLLGFVVLVAAAAAVVLSTLWSGATLSADQTALARLTVQPFGGTVQSAEAVTASGKHVPLSLHNGLLVPTSAVAPGVQLTISVTLQRSSLVSWAAGRTHTVHLTVTAPPAAHLTSGWLSVPPGGSVRVTFDEPVAAIAYGSPGHLQHETLSTPQRTVTLLTSQTTGTVEVAAATRSWETFGAPAPVTWFPATATGGVVVSPAPGSTLGPLTPIRLTFSKPVSSVLGSALPALDPASTGSWEVVGGGHTLIFTPSGLGIPTAEDVLTLRLPHAIALVGATGARTVSRLAWPLAQPTTLRLQELLAQAGYLPVRWTGRAVARTASAQVRAAVHPPAGPFSWRYPNTPPELERLWRDGQPNTIVRGAVMTFEEEHGLAVDGIAGPMVWHALLADTLAGRRRHAAYSYVFVHENVPQLLTLWSAGHTVLTSPGNTGIASRPTAVGTFPVFEHVPVGTMSGTNPDGSHYHDPGIQWISYFNGGDAIHAYNRASFGTPQSLGCVELPLAAAAKVWPYTPIGTLVTIEH